MVELHRRRVTRGGPWTLKEFATTYGLADDEATRLFTRFGPSMIDLMLLMTAKGVHPEAKQSALSDPLRR